MDRLGRSTISRPVSQSIHFQCHATTTINHPNAAVSQVGYKSVDDYVKSGMVVGLGTGSTAAFAGMHMTACQFYTSD